MFEALEAGLEAELAYRRERLTAGGPTILAPRGRSWRTGRGRRTGRAAANRLR